MSIYIVGSRQTRVNIKLLFFDKDEKENFRYHYTLHMILRYHPLFLPRLINVIGRCISFSRFSSMIDTTKLFAVEA